MKLSSIKAKSVLVFVPSCPLTGQEIEDVRFEVLGRPHVAEWKRFAAEVVRPNLSEADYASVVFSLLKRFEIEGEAGTEERLVELFTSPDTSFIGSQLVEFIGEKSNFFECIKPKGKKS